MEINISASQVKAKLRAPASKSMLQRALLAAFLVGKEFVIEGYSSSADADAVLDVVRKLGTDVRKEGNRLFLSPEKEEKSAQLNVGESGLAIRLLSPILALYDQAFTLAAQGTLRKRPMDLIEKSLQANQVICSSNNGFAPLHICGPLAGGAISLDASEGSQFLSGLLMALPKAKKDSSIKVENLKSKPYVLMTLGLLKDFGIQIEAQGFQHFRIAGNQSYQGSRYNVEGDWSAAAFLLTAAAIGGSLRLENIRKDSLQGDKAIVAILREVGAYVQQERESIFVEKNELNAFSYDATETPDLFPPLAALAVACKGQSRIKGVHRLKHKESNRAETIRKVFEDLKLKIAFEGDEMIIEGGNVDSGRVSSFHDHRIAMMGALLGLISKNSVTITEAESVEKSYPNFFEDLKLIGVEMVWSKF
jgi:3-phosphoshikimate 1-carboxyvinyltransferase